MKKTSFHTQWMCVLLTATVLLGSGAASNAQAPAPTETYKISFDTDPPSWIYWYGLGFNNNQIDWDGTKDAATNANSGSLLISLPFGPPANGNAQGVWFGTFGNGGAYDGSVRYNANGFFTNISFDIFVDPTNTPTTAGDFGAIQVSLVRSGTPSGGGPFPTNTTAIIPGGATNRWVRLSVPVNTGADAAGFDDPGVIGVVFRKANFGGSPFQAYPQVPMTFWIDNISVAFSGTPPPPPPPPTLLLDKAYPGLNFFAGGPGDFDRQSIRTIGTDAGLSYSWVGQGTNPVTYAFTISGAPGPGHNNYQVMHTFIHPAPTGGGDAPDYSEPNGIFVDLNALNDGSAEWVFRWKMNSPNGNGQFFNAIDGGINGPYARITNVTALGTWSLTFVNDTNVTMTTPGGAKTDFNINPTLAALFPNPIALYWGIMPDSQVQANKGLPVGVSRISVKGSIDTFDEDFLSQTELDTVNTWRRLGNTPNGIFIMPKDTKYVVSWRSANQGNLYTLEYDSVLGDGVATPWKAIPSPATPLPPPLDTLPTPLNLNIARAVLISPVDLPNVPNAFFRGVKP